MQVYDAIVIGAGVSGCAIARELSMYGGHFAVIERTGLKSKRPEPCNAQPPYLMPSHSARNLSTNSLIYASRALPILRADRVLSSGAKLKRFS